MEVYPDICVITDTKFTESDVFTIQFDSMLADARELGLTYLFDRIAIQVYSGNMRTGLHNIYPFPHYIYTLYQDEDFTGTKDSFRERAAYCAKHGIKGIAIDQHWWNPAFASIADEYGIQLYVHTVNDAATAKKLLDAGCDAVYTDSLTPAQLS
jgi:glycerophosphoryl diester phosphodiesterase